MKKYSYGMITNITAVAAIICFLLLFILPWSYETQISEYEYMSEASFLPFISLLLGIFLAIISIIFGVKSYFEKHENKFGSGLKKLSIISTTGFIIGFILTILGIFFVFLGLGSMGGIGGEFVYGLIMILIGSILIVGFLMMVLIRSSSVKKLTGIVSFLIVSILISCSLYYYGHNTLENYYDNHFDNTCYPDIYFIADTENKTLTVTNINFYDHVNWSNIYILHGNATLPTGNVDLGDIITNCSSRICLVWEPTATALGYWDF